MNKIFFGKTKDGEDVFKYILKNELLEIGIINYGGIITDILVGDKNKGRSNVVLGFDNITDYENKSPYFGCITGRNAGRITKGVFNLNNVQHKLDVNNGENHLHGGVNGLNRRVWDVEQLDNKLKLSYFSPHGEEGYPGNIKFEVTYTLIGNELAVDYLGVTDRDTIINLTNHTYFNLSGDVSQGVLNHELFINSDKYAELDESSALTGNFIAVENTPLDFRKTKPVGRDIDREFKDLILAKGYDHPFILNKDKKIEMIVKEHLTGRVLEVETDQKVVVFYSGNYLGSEGILSSGKESIRRGGLCLETQDLPNYINVDKWDKNIYSIEKPYVAKTIYRFKIEE